MASLRGRKRNEEDGTVMRRGDVTQFYTKQQKPLG